LSFSSFCFGVLANPDERAPPITIGTKIMATLSTQASTLNGREGNCGKQLINHTPRATIKRCFHLLSMVRHPQRQNPKVPSNKLETSIDCFVTMPVEPTINPPITKKTVTMTTSRTTRNHLILIMSSLLEKFSPHHFNNCRFTYCFCSSLGFSGSFLRHSAIHLSKKNNKVPTTAPTPSNTGNESSTPNITLLAAATIIVPDI